VFITRGLRGLRRLWRAHDRRSHRSVVVGSRGHRRDGAADGASLAAPGVADRHRFAAGVGDVRRGEPPAGISGTGRNLHDCIRPADVAGVAGAEDTWRESRGWYDIAVIQYVPDRWTPLATLVSEITRREHIDRADVIAALGRLSRWQYVDIWTTSDDVGLCVSYVRLHSYPSVD